MYKVFLADDEMWVLRGLKKLIDKSGCPFRVVGEASNGVVAMESLEHMDVDVLFTDIRMPGYTGLELMEWIRQKRPDLLVVFISGYAEFEYAKQAIGLGVFEYLLKPLEEEQLRQTLRRLQERLEGDTNQDTGDTEEQEEVNPSLMRSIVKEIQERYTENITLTNLAEKYGISIGHLSNCLKAELGLSFSEYLTAKRIQRAKELLANENLSIDEVAEQSGYSDYFYFTKAFKKNVGVSPSKYRQSL